MSVQGILSFASVVVAFLIFYGTVKIIKKRGREDGISVSFMAFFIVSSIYHILLFQLVDGDDRHLIPLYILYVPALAIIFESVKKNMPRLKARMLVSGIAFVIICGGLIRLHALPEHDNTSYRKNSIAYLEENNLRFGFASFWNANVITELTNGRIGILGLHPDDYHELNVWLYPVAYEDPDYYKGETFLLLTKTELETMPDKNLSRRKPDYEDDNFVIFRYPSTAVVFEEVIMGSGL
jgi:hypothetical protein